MPFRLGNLLQRNEPVVIYKTILIASANKHNHVNIFFSLSLVIEA